MGRDGLWPREYQRENIAAKRALNNLQIRKERFTACLRRASRATVKRICKRTMKLMIVQICDANNQISMSSISLGA
jgi:hypothetical protein